MKAEYGLVPHKRPHFHLKESALYFLISRRAYLNLEPDEEKVWTAIDGNKSVKEIEDEEPQAKEILTKFWKKEAIEYAPNSPPAGRRKILIVEPHMDDAILSLGATMWNLRNDYEFDVVSVTGRSNFTSYYRLERDYLDTDKVTRLRRDESELAMRVLGGTHRVLDQHDAPLRYQPDGWTLEWYRQHRRSISGYVNHSITSAELESWVASVSPILQDSTAEEIWIPIGIGSSADHEATRNACMLAATRNRDHFKDQKFLFYHEVPYAMNFPWHIREHHQHYREIGVGLTREDISIDDALKMKQRLVSIFASQFKMSYIGPKVEATAKQLAPRGKELGEPLLYLDKLPNRFEPDSFFSGRRFVEKTLKRLPSWLKAVRKAKKLTLVCPGGFGRWQEDIEPLISIMPDLRIEVHLSADALAETERFKSDLIELKPVPPSPRAWVTRLISLVRKQPRPIAILTGRQLEMASPALRLLFFLSKPLITAKPAHLARALAQSETSRENSRNSQPQSIN
ncbi:MAG: hypothetical protein CMK36_08000 [Porticoccaceae bacterium]|nr:hypothetical protein [Porticoccaceae bacterium]